MDELSKLGHYLKGSSATLGLVHIRDSCEKIQHWGAGYDETGSNSEDPEKCLTFISKEVRKLRAEYGIVRKALTEYYHVE